jgi:hypothetical protein
LPSKVDERGILIVDRGIKKIIPEYKDFLGVERGAYAPLKPPFPPPLNKTPMF